MSDQPQKITFSATDRERFDVGLGMLKAYYDALEGRVTVTVGFFVGVVGWLVTSLPARHALKTEPWLLAIAVVTLTLLLAMYGLNVARWLSRWRQVRERTDALQHMEPQFYVRYEIPAGLWWIYFAPVALLYVVVMLCFGLIVWGKLHTTSP